MREVRQTKLLLQFFYKETKQMSSERNKYALSLSIRIFILNLLIKKLYKNTNTIFTYIRCNFSIILNKKNLTRGNRESILRYINV